MKKTTIQDIEYRAKDLQGSGKKWHFHILTPDCQLNETDQYSLVLENTSDNEIWVCYSDEPYMDIGQKLVKILHGDDVVKENEEEKTQEPSSEVKRLLNRAKEINSQGKFWHHHMLFPGCRFNKHQGKFVIVFEDQENNEVVESMSDDEPKSDLQHIEGFFYAQKR